MSSNNNLPEGTSPISKFVSSVFENARENFEEYRALCEEAKKLMSEQQSLSAQTNNIPLEIRFKIEV